MANKPIEDRGWTEPESAASVENPPKPPYNNITQTPSGHMFEMDDTNSRERVRLQHRTGTFIEMHPNGDEVHKVYGTGYEITIKNKNVLIKGHCNITIEGDSIIDIKGDKIERVAGDYNLQVKGFYNVYAKKDISLSTPGDVQVGAGTEIGGGTIKLVTADHLYLSGDLSIAGDLTADLITSTTRVDAGTGVRAGPLGFVSTLGGLSIGVPVAIPETILCLGTINAGVAINSLGPISAATAVNAGASVNSPIGNFGLMDAFIMTDVWNTSMYNFHKHPFVTFHGPGITAFPTLPMF
jgi:hypothetical protein